MAGSEADLPTATGRRRMGTLGIWSFTRLDGVQHCRELTGTLTLARLSPGLFLTPASVVILKGIVVLLFGHFGHLGYHILPSISVDINIRPSKLKTCQYTKTVFQNCHYFST